MESKITVFKSTDQNIEYVLVTPTNDFQNESNKNVDINLADIENEPEENVKIEVIFPAVYFNSGMGVLESCRYHESVLELKEDFTEERLASGRINPTKRTVNHWHDEWRKMNLGPRTGAGMIEKLKEKMEKYMEKNITVKFTEDPFAVVIITPLMRRAHKLEMSRDIVFVDSTSSCDVDSHSVTFILTPSAAGAVPLGIVITKGQTEEAYANGLKIFSDEVADSFCGQHYPNIFMTDHSQAEINALALTWPFSRNLLCIFHICQAVWKWLWDSKHCIPKDTRPKLMNDFQQVLYSFSFAEAEDAYNTALESGRQFSNWCKYLADYWKIKEKWCLTWRDATTRGHNTNNFSETTVRLFKDNVLTRVKAYNVITLVDFSCTVLEEFYCYKLRQFANNRSALARLFLKSLLQKTTYLHDSDISMINDNEYIVPSEKDKDVTYYINVRGGCCSCVYGKGGRFYKHQCAVYRVYDVVSINFPPVTAADRHCIAHLALGDKPPPLSFYMLFQLQSTSNVCISNGHRDPDTSCEHVSDPSSSDNKEEEEENVNISDINVLLEECDEKFGSTSDGLKKLHRRLMNISSKGQWETFIHTAGNTVPLRRKSGIAIRVQPSALSRRSPNVTRGSKRILSGRLPKGVPM